jgi:hypothetical protein
MGKEGGKKAVEERFPTIMARRESRKTNSLSFIKRLECA